MFGVEGAWFSVFFDGARPGVVAPLCVDGVFVITESRRARGCAEARATQARTAKEYGA